MAKKLLGIDIGYDRLKLVLVSGKKVKKAVIVPMPNNLIKEGRVVSIESMGELIRSTMRENGLHCSNAAVVLSNESVFVKNVTMPRMTADRLVYNLPFEFRDYITDELKNYAFDYAMITDPETLKASAPEEGDEETDTSRTMELLAVACPTVVLEETRDYLRKAGLKLVKAAPTVCAFSPLIRQMQQRTGASGGEYCILDLGYQAVRMYMFKGDSHQASRVLEVGLSTIDDVIADAYNVDVHLAHTYLLTNHDNCQEKEFCRNAFNNIAVELMRAINFYRFNNPDSQLNDIWICGGGAEIESLRTAIAETLDMNLHNASELVPNGEGFDECHTLIQAVGITQD